MAEPRPAKLLHLHRAAGEGASLEVRDDDALMVLAARDHPGAFDLLASRHLGPLTRFCAKFLGDRGGGEEIAQDVLFEAWSGRLRYRAQGRFRVYLFTLARNRCLRRIRGERRHRAAVPFQLVEVGADAAAPGLHALDGLLERERERRVRAALLGLAPGMREALLLRFDNGLSYAEIASVVGRREVTVRARVFQALKKLRATLAAEVKP